MADCDCPLPSEISDLTDFDCPENWGQIQKVAFQRRDALSLFSGTGLNPIETLASWTAFLTAVDDTKIVITSFVEAFTILAGDPVLEGGGDNSTLNGVEIVAGRDPSTVEGMIKSAPQTTVIKDLKTLQCEGKLTAYFFNEFGNIIASEVVLDDDYNGFDVQSMFIGDKNNEGFGTRDSNAFRFALKGNWSDTARVIIPTFNPLTDL